MRLRSSAPPLPRCDSHQSSPLRATRLRRSPVHEWRRSEAIRGHQRPSEAIRGDQRRSEAIRGDQRRSEAIRSQQRPSEAIRGVVEGHQRGRRRPSEGLSRRRTAKRASSSGTRAPKKTRAE
jgi:hypothetical protein